MRILIFMFIVSLTACTPVGPVSKNTMTSEDLAAISEAIPIKIVNPRYPLYAAKNHIEGFVVFVFDIDSEGSPKNIRLLTSEPEGVFERHALASIEQWKFKPKYENGVPVTQEDMRYTLEFKFAD